MYAVAKGNLRDAEILLSMDALKGSKDWENHPLIVAVENKDSDMANLLLENGADPTYNTSDGWNALMAASLMGDLTCARLLLNNRKKEKVKLMLQTRLFPDSWDALLIACFYGNFPIVRLLLKFGANVHTSCTTAGWCAIHSAAYSGCCELIEYLYSMQGIDVNERRDDGGTPLMAATFKGHSAGIRLLLRNGAKVNLKMQGGTTALMIAAEQGDLESCRILCTTGRAEVLQMNSLGETAIDLADGAAVAAYLRDTVTRSPLQRAVEARDRNLVEEYLSSDLRLSYFARSSLLSLSRLPNYLYGLPVSRALVKDLQSAFWEAWSPTTSHLFPHSLTQKARTLLSSNLLPEALWLHVISFFTRDD